ncbi:helix-turn-helix transcriptional regulator [Streptomyces sp. NPDC051320]|uniref:helix-turn-helix domain-containing protein n=1 Tax=Streptomyces sp. NPDC051320 TaxID=3154644 RepID=UPI003449335F
MRVRAPKGSCGPRPTCRTDHTRSSAALCSTRTVCARCARTKASWASRSRKIRMLVPVTRPGCGHGGRPPVSHPGGAGERVIVSRTHITHIEAGRRPPSAEDARRLDQVQGAAAASSRRSCRLSGGNCREISAAHTARDDRPREAHSGGAAVDQQA